MKKSLLSILSVFVLLTLFRCTDSPTKPETDAYQHYEQSGEVGSGGGTIEITDENSKLNGSTLEIPSGALNNAVTVKIDPSTDVTDIHGNTDAVIVDLQPSGTTFEKPVKLTLPYKINIPGKPAAIYFLNKETHYWEKCKTVSIDENAKTVTAEIWHFSEYAAVNEDVVIDTKLYKTSDNKIAINFKLLTPLESFHPSNPYGYSNLSELAQNKPEELYVHYVVELCEKLDGYEDGTVVSDRKVEYYAENRYSVNFWDVEKEKLIQMVPDVDFISVKKLFSGESFILVFDDFTPKANKKYSASIFLAFLAPGSYPANLYGYEGYTDGGYEYATFSNMPSLSSIDENGDLIVDRLQNAEGAPTAAFTVSPGVGGTDTEFTFDASASWDTEDDISDLLFSWDWENDGTWDVENVSDYQQKHTFPTDGDYEIKLRVEDLDGNSDTFTRSIEIFSNAIINFQPVSGVQSGDIKIRYTVNDKPYDQYDFDFLVKYIDETGVEEYILMTNLKDISAGDYDGSYTIRNVPAGAHSFVWESDKSFPLNSKHVQVYALWSKNTESGTAGMSAPFEIHNIQDVNHAPESPYYPNPKNNAENVNSGNLNLSWYCSDKDGDPITYDLYWGTQSNPPLYASNLSSRSYNLGSVSDNTTYFWKIVAKDDKNQKTQGPVWTFTTANAASNTAPTASFSISPSSGSTATDFSFDPSASTDNEDATSALQVRWDWENDGNWDTGFFSMQTITHRYTSEGTKTVKLEVKDTGGLTDTKTKTVTVSSSNTAPTASFTVDPTSGDTNTNFQFDASASSDNEDNFSQLRFSWDWEDDGSWDMENSTNYSPTHTYGSAGTYTVRLRVTDSDGAYDVATLSVTVTAANTAPTASFSVSPTNGTTETTFNFDASASSDNEDNFSQLRFSWDWEDDGHWDMENSTSYSPTHTYGSDGVYTVRLRVTDSDGAYDETTRTISVGSGQPIGNDMVYVPGGAFQMGDTWGDGDSNEKPVHTVTVNSFYMGKYEVTNAQVVEVFNWALQQGKITATSSTVKNTEGNAQELLDLNDSDCQISYNGSALYVENNYDNYPVIEITWYGAAAFCNYFSEREGLAPVYDLSDWTANWNANGYRLPTEAEWEYAARGGNQSQGYKYSGSDNPDDVAWYYNNSGSSTHTVGTKQANELGLYDMSGNVWEWCWDWYGAYSSDSQTDPKGPDSGSYRVERGGSWHFHSEFVRVAVRGVDYTSDSRYDVGFRLLRTK